MTIGSEHRTRRLIVAELTESSVAERIGAICRELENPTTALLASPGQVELLLSAWGETAEDAEEKLGVLTSRLREALGDDIVSDAGETLEQVLGGVLSQRGKTLSVAESCTGGLITHRLTEVAGSSRYFERGFVTYSNQSKVELLGVSENLIREHGAVSEPVARAMARGARTRAGTDLALAVTGIAGPGGASPDKPVGLVFIAISDNRGVVVRRFQLTGERSKVKLWTSQLALDLLRRRLLEK